MLVLLKCRSPERKRRRGSEPAVPVTLAVSTLDQGKGRGPRGEPHSDSS